MGKMSCRRRKAKKMKNKLAKLMKSLIKIKPRIPVAPAGSRFKSKKDYDRKENNKVINKELNNR